MRPEVIAERRQCCTNDPEKARAWLAGVYAEFDFAGAPRTGFRFSGDVTFDRRFTVGRVGLAGRAACLLRPRGVAAGAGIRGERRWEVGDRFGGDDPAIFADGRSVGMILDHVERLMVDFDPAALERTARLVYGDDRIVLRFDSPHPLSPRHGASFAAALHATAELAASDSFASPLVRSAAYRHLAVTALESFRLCGDRAERAVSAANQERAFRRAKAFLDDFASLPITVDDAAQHAGVSAASLRRAFAAHDAATPEEYLRQVRFAAARDDLMRGDPLLGGSVREVALRWGFASPSRFARRYRAAFGEPPGETRRS
jgi:AraC-like DNA-binding protein